MAVEIAYDRGGRNNRRAPSGCAKAPASAGPIPRMDALTDNRLDLSRRRYPVVGPLDAIAALRGGSSSRRLRAWSETVGLGKAPRSSIQ